MNKKLITAMMVSACTALTATSQEIATWADWKKAAVTFTFDDGANEARSHEWAAQQLKKYNYPATFYVVTNWANGQWNVYQNLANSGHEIGSHTTSHNSTDSELAPSKRTIEQNIKGQSCLTIAYPNCNVPTESQVLANYIGGRICGGQINSKSPSNFARLDCKICGNQGINSTDQFTSFCNSAKNSGGWAVFLIHGISGYEGNGSYSPTSQNAFTGTLSWLDQNKSTFWVTTFRDACMYIKERDNSTLTKVSSDASSDTYSLTLKSNLSSNKVCNWDYPLSIRVPMQNGWSNIKVTQSDNELESEVKDGYVYFKAVPNGGNIVVGSGAPAVPDPEFSFTEPAKGAEWCKDSVYTIKWNMTGDTNGKEFTLNWSTGSSAGEIEVSSVSASSEWSNDGGTFSWSVDNILSDDGSHGESSRWGSVSGKDEYVIFTFASTQSVGGVKIDEFTEYDKVSSFEIQYDDNGTWKTAYKGTTIGNDFKATFSPVSTKKMRFYIKESGDGSNINYVAFTGVAGIELKKGITGAGSYTWKASTTGKGTLTIDNPNGRTLASSASITIANCGGGGEEENPDTPDTPGNTTGGGDFFTADSYSAYYGPSCKDGKTNTGAFYTGVYPSPFKTYLNKTDEEIQKKLDQLWNHYFKGNSNQTVYYENSNGTAYIKDINNNDVRSEGQSYGMMICVQTNHKAEFDKLWKYAKQYMLHTSGQWQGYFKWKCNPDGSSQDTNCAPDGEMYFVTALMLAANRWGEKSYMEDAQYCLKNFWKGGNGSLFNESTKIITFQPYNCSNFGDPSYDLPAFVELFAMWSDTNKDKWESCLAPTRNHLKVSCHSTSGLFADYSEFNGQPTTGGFSSNSNKYMYDAMRCAMNVGMDYYLFGHDKSTQKDMMTRLINHFEKDGYSHARFNWDGTGGSDSYTLGECGANAVGCFALMDDPANDSKVKTNLKKAWDGQLMTGQYRYYDGLVHYLAMLHLCGSFKIYKPQPSVKALSAEGSYNGVTYDKDTELYDFKDCQLYKVTVKAAMGTEVADASSAVKGIQIAPNPADNQFYVNCAETIAKIELTDMTGRTVLSESYEGEVKINLPAGLYLVKATTAEGNIYVEKIQVK